MLRRLLITAGLALLLSFTCSFFIGNADAVPMIVERTTSGQVVLLPGDQSETAQFPVPACPTGSQFLVTGLIAAPETEVGNTGNDVVNLGRWVAKVAVYQCYASTTCIQVPLTVLGNGPQHVAQRLEAGQALGNTPPANPLFVTVQTLPVSAPNTARQQFNVHVTGICGVPFVAP